LLQRGSPVGESNIIGEEDHLLGELLGPVIPEGSTLHAPLHLRHTNHLTCLLPFCIAYHHSIWLDYVPTLGFTRDTHGFGQYELHGHQLMQRADTCLIAHCDMTGIGLVM